MTDSAPATLEMSHAEPEVNPLGAAFGFTTFDIRQNREGRLSVQQGQRLMRRFMVTALEGVLLVSVPILLAWGLIWWGTEQPLLAALTDSRAGFGVLIGAVLGLLYGLANWRTLLLLPDVLAGRVKSISGVVRVWGAYLVVGEYRFPMEEAPLQMLQNGLHYRVFLLPRSRTLLSIEFSE